MIVVSSSFNIISDEIRNAYNPFESCASAQMLIKNERSDEMILSVSRRTVSYTHLTLPTILLV